MTFKVCNLSSKRPHLHKVYVLGVYSNLGTTVPALSNMLLLFTASKKEDNNKANISITTTTTCTTTITETTTTTTSTTTTLCETATETICNTYRYVHMKPLHGMFMKENGYFSKLCDAV